MNVAKKLKPLARPAEIPNRPEARTSAYLKIRYHLFATGFIQLAFCLLGALVTGVIMLFFEPVIGLILILSWIILTGIQIGFTHWFSIVAYNRLNYELTSEAIIVVSGVIFHKKSRIPLTRVQDVLTIQGPIERMFNISTLRIQTAGMSGTTGSEGKLLGIADPESVAKIIMEQVQKVQQGGI